METRTKSTILLSMSSLTLLTIFSKQLIGAKGQHVGRPMYAHELRPGDEYEPLEFVISNDSSQQFLYAIEDYNPVYLGASGTRPQLHPMILLHMTARTRSKSFRLPSHMGSVFAKERVKFCRPAYVGDKLTARWRISDVYEKNFRIYQAISIQLASEQGLVLDREMHSVFYTKATDPTVQRAAS